MNYATFPSNYCTSSPQTQLQFPNGLNYSGYNQQNIAQPFQGNIGQFQNNYQFPLVPYAQPTNSIFNQSSLIQFPPKATDVPYVATKRPSKPLTVCDPVNKEAIDLFEFTKSIKPTSLLDEIKPVSPYIKASVSLGAIASIDAKPHKSRGQDDSTVHYVAEHNLSEYNDCVVSDNIDNDFTDNNNIHEKPHNIDVNKNNVDDTMKSHTITSSTSIPNKLESLSNGFHQTSMSSSEETLSKKTNDDKCETSDGDKNRLVYNRQSLIELSKSPLCRKPHIDCKEIEGHASKINDLTSKLKSNSILECSENGYKPPNKRQNEENTYLETIRRHFRSILNKIAPQNFALCFSEIKTLLTDTDWSDVTVEEYMTCIIDEIFLKAVQEEAYSVTYADLCTEIIQYEIQNDMNWNFKSQLIRRCKNMFKTPLQDQLKTVRNHWEKKIEDETDNKLKVLYISDIEEQVKKAKDKFFGNIRFIGELYLHDLLVANIINDCVNELLSKRTDEDALLSLCKLLETCGKKFDVKHNDKMKGYICNMKEIENSADIHIRIRYRLLDIIDMSERKWQLRTIQAQKIIKPKTLDQVKQDDIDEKYLEASRLSNKSKTSGNKKSNYSADLRFKSNQNKNQSLEINSLHMQTTRDIELQPPCRSWNTGSGVKDEEWHDSNKRKSAKSSGNYSQQNHKSKSDCTRDYSPSYASYSGKFASLQETELNSCVDVDHYKQMPKKIIPECQELRVTESSSAASTREQSPSLLDVEEIEILDSDGVLDQFLDSGHLHVHSWCQITDVSKTLATWIDRIMEKSKSTRNSMGDELATLVAHGQLSMDDLIDGLKTFSSDIDDLKPDIPLIWNFLAEFLERFITDSDSDISFLKSIFESQWSQMDLLNCICLCLKYADNRLGHDVISRVLGNCTWSLRDFSAIDHQYLTSRDLTFLLDFIIDPLYFDQFKNDLSVLLPDNVDKFEAYVTDTFSPDVIQTSQCVYFIAFSIFSHLIHLPEEKIELYLRDRTLFFLRLIDRKPVLEKQILSALHDCKHLSENEGLLTTVVQYLTDYILSFDSIEEFSETTTIENGSGKCTVNVIRSIPEIP